MKLLKVLLQPEGSENNRNNGDMYSMHTLILIEEIMMKKLVIGVTVEFLPFKFDC